MKRLLDMFRGGKESHSQKTRQTPAANKPADVESPFRAVGIKIDSNNCCAEAKQLVGIRFLIKEAPLLRLPDCSNPNCGCSYINYPDRREGPRRKRDDDFVFDINSPWGDDNDRRRARGRRAHDLNWAR